MTRIALVYFDAGGGHRAAATALQQIIQQQQLPWSAELVNLQELLDPLDFIRRFTGLRIQDVYNNMLRNGWTLGSPELMRILQWVIRARHGATVRLLEKYWREWRPDLVVSFVPHFNRALYDSLTAACPGKPLVTLLTDIADYPEHFWIERQEQFLICGSEKAVEQARARGHADSHIFATSGMILNPRFYNYERVDRRAERIRLGLDPDRVTALMLFGGQGNWKMLDIDRRLSRSGLPLQIISICGKNDKLAQALRTEKSSLPRFIEGFTTHIPYYMQLADFFLGKPGPGSIAEAIHMGLPVIVERNAWTLPQERYNATWVLEKQTGLVVGSFKNVDAAVREMLAENHLTRFHQNAVAMQNRALFEIPEILRQILERGKGEAVATSAPSAAAG